MHASITPKPCIRIEHSIGITISLTPCRNLLLVGNLSDQKRILSLLPTNSLSDPFWCTNTTIYVLVLVLYMYVYLYYILWTRTCIIYVLVLCMYAYLYYICTRTCTIDCSRTCTIYMYSYLYYIYCFAIYCFFYCC